MMHVMGFLHEHNAFSQADHFVKDYDERNPEFENMRLAECLQIGQYDFNSVMHYHFSKHTGLKVNNALPEHMKKDL